MSSLTDHQLLSQYAERGDQEAFGQLVERHLPLVLSAARRKLGDASLAEDVAQQVFTVLARKAPDLEADAIVSGWLYRTACHLSARAQRTELRRVTREQFAVSDMNEAAARSAWRDIEPELDEAMETLSETDRDAVVLRYFENKSLREVGSALGTSEDAVQKRLCRAVEKLRTHFSQRGRTVAASSLTAALMTGAIHPAPPALAATLSAAVLADAALITTATTTLTAMPHAATMTSMIKPALAGLAALTAAGGLLIQHRQLNVQKAENAALHASLNEAEASAQAATAESVPIATGLDDNEKAELLRLRGEVARFRAETARLKDRGPDRRAQAAAEVVTGNDSETSQPPEQQIIQENIDVLKHVGLALRILASDAGNDPTLAELKFTPGAPLPKQFTDLLGPQASSLDQIELLVPDMAWMTKAELTPESIVARSRNVFTTADGKFMRIYSLGDGSVQRRTHSTEDEVYGWGQMLDGLPVAWTENGSATQPAAPTLQMDPALLKRYGLVPTEK